MGWNASGDDAKRDRYRKQLSLRRLWHKPRPSRCCRDVADPGRATFPRRHRCCRDSPISRRHVRFAAERLNYQVRRRRIPMHNLPPALDGMEIVQISDVHLKQLHVASPQVAPRRGYGQRSRRRSCGRHRRPHHRHGDSIADCVRRSSPFARAPWHLGLQRNHEITRAWKTEAADLFAQAGMKLCAMRSAITFKGAQFIYRRGLSARAHFPRPKTNIPWPASSAVVATCHILLSHNPNSFNRAAELASSFSLAGPPTAARSQVKSSDHRLSPARFITDYIAGLYQRPLFAAAVNERASGTGGQARVTMHLLPWPAST